MASRRSIGLRNSTFPVYVIVALLLTSSFALTSKSASQSYQLTGAIWTTDPKGERVNGNLFTNPRSVYLAGGPYKKGGLGLPDGDYYFQVTNPAGTALLSTDDLANRRFTVTGGIISAVYGHASRIDKRRGGLLVQLWPFDCPTSGGGFKVWVTRVEDWGDSFVPSLSKTDNFKVKLNGETQKYFELWVTTGVNGIDNVAFYVNYTTEENPTLWTSEQLFEDRAEDTLTVFQDGTTFPTGTSIYWQFEVHANAGLLWASDLHGPEPIVEENMVNMEVVFRIDGHKYDADGSGLPDWCIILFEDNQAVEQTVTDGTGYYYFVSSVPGNYKVLCQGLTTEEKGETWYEFDAVSGVDRTFDFYDSREILNMGNLPGTEMSLFDVIFTPSNDGSDLYKFSSTNPGSFHLDLDLCNMYDPGRLLTIEINLPEAGANAFYDSPNFILHHAYRGDTPTVDLHVFTDATMVLEITDSFSISSNDEMVKNLRITGVVPSTGSLFVTVHVDYQIDGSLEWQQALSFQNFTYTFEAVVVDNVFGVHVVFGVH